MENINYKKYEEDKGFEKFQAQIYNAVIQKYDGQPVTAEAIRKRLQDHKPTQDKNGITFAFNGDNDPIAYIQYREYTGGKVRIGYPWAIDGTPVEVQDKLFYDLLEYLKNKYPDKEEFYLGNLNYAYTEVHDKIVNHYHFDEHSWFAFYTIENQSLSKITIPDNISYQEVHQSSLDIICNVCLKDPSFDDMGKEGIKTFFNTRIFSEENSKTATTVLLERNNQPVGLIAVTESMQKDKKNSQVRIIALEDGDNSLYEYLLGALGKTLLGKGNTSPAVLVFIDNTVPYQEEFLKAKGGEFVSKALEYKLKVR